MEKRITCVDVTKELLDEASARFQPLWVRNDQRADYTLDACRKLDDLCSACDCECFEVEIDEITMEIRFMLTSTGFDFTQQAVGMLRLFSRIYIMPGKEDRTVDLTVWLPGVWEKEG